WYGQLDDPPLRTHELVVAVVDEEREAYKRREQQPRRLPGPPEAMFTKHPSPYRQPASCHAVGSEAGHDGYANAQASAVQSWVEEKKRDDEAGDEEAERGTGRRVEAVAGIVVDASETNLDGDEEQPGIGAAVPAVQPKNVSTPGATSRSLSG